MGVVAVDQEESMERFTGVQRMEDQATLWAGLVPGGLGFGATLWAVVAVDQEAPVHCDQARI